MSDETEPTPVEQLRYGAAIKELREILDGIEREEVEVGLAWDARELGRRRKDDARRDRDDPHVAGAEDGGAEVADEVHPVHRPPHLLPRAPALRQLRRIMRGQ